MSEQHGPEVSACSFFHHQLIAQSYNASSTACGKHHVPEETCLCASHLVLRGTYSGRLSPVLQPALCQRGSAPPPTSAPAAAMALPYECLEITTEAGSQHSALACSFGKKPLNSLCLPTFLFTRGLGLPMGQVSKLHFSVDPREVTVPLLREKSQRYL